MKHKYTLLLLSLFIILGATLRFYKLGEIPDSLNWDEVSWGYNGISIWETGRDEHGEFLPLSFEAFGDFKQPVYVYLNAISIGLFGANAFAVRFPSALVGTLSIIFTYLFVFELFSKHKRRNAIALIASGLIAVSPWSVQFSRVAFEANVGQFFVLLGAWLFIKGVNAKQWTLLYLSTIPLAVSAFTYHSEKLFTPLFFGGLLLFGYKYFWSQKKKTVILIILFIILNLPWFVDTRTTARGRSVTYSSNQTQLLSDSTTKLAYEQNKGLFLGKTIYNRRIVYANKYIENYLLHFDPNFLFMKGDNARHHPPGIGVLYLVLLPMILVGMREVIKYKSKETFLILLWFLLAPVAAALAIDAPNASRSLIFLPIWQIFASVGWVYAYFKLRESSKYKYIVPILSILFVCNVFYFVHQYFNHTNTDMQRYWQYGYKQAVETTSLVRDSTIYFDDSIEQGYIFYLFHSNISPAQYLASGGLVKVDFDCYGINNARFGSCINHPPVSGDILVTTNTNLGSSYVPINQFTTQDDQVTVSVLRYEK